jgi:hypothetical protein
MAISIVCYFTFLNATLKLPAKVLCFAMGKPKFARRELIELKQLHLAADTWS